MSIGISPHTVKHPFRVRPNDPTDRLSLSHARTEGYKVTVIGDGYGEVRKPDGTTYYVSDFICTCPDAIKRDGGSYHGFCKHSFWVHQIHICDCGGQAEMFDFETPHGAHDFNYVCHDCGTVKSVQEVVEDRRKWKEETARLAEQRRQAEVIEQGQRASEAVYA